MKDFPPYMIIIESCVAGAVVAFAMTMIFHQLIMRERSRQLKEEDDTDEATATVLAKDTETRSTGGENHGTQVIYKVTYEFSAEKADGTPCMVRVFGREIDCEAWKRLDEGGTVQVLYLAGRPGSCRMKDMVEIEASRSNMFLIAASFGLLLIGAFFSVFACAAVYFAWVFAQQSGLIDQSATDEPVDVRTMKTGIVLGFSLSFCGCSVLRAGQAYLNRNTDAIYDIGTCSGMTEAQTVVVEELHESDSDDLLDN